MASLRCERIDVADLVADADRGINSQASLRHSCFFFQCCFSMNNRGSLGALSSQQHRLLIKCSIPSGESLVPQQQRSLSVLESLQAASKGAKQLVPRHTGRAQVTLPVTQNISGAVHYRSTVEECSPAATPCAVHDDDPILQPSCMPFDAMCMQLDAWYSRFGSCIVPRFCFDATELGAWVRYMRRLHRKHAIERWKADRLNLLGFDWAVSMEDAKWHANLHHLRQFKALHPSAGDRAVVEAVEPFDDGQHGAWQELAGWAREQGIELIGGRLPFAKQQALSAVGISLRVPQLDVDRSVRLQGLNAHERRLARKRWKVADKKQAAQQGVEAQQDALVSQGERKRQELELVRRHRVRRTLLRAGDLQVACDGSGDSDADGWQKSGLGPMGQEEGQYIQQGADGSSLSMYDMPQIPGPPQNDVGGGIEYDLDW